MDDPLVVASTREAFRSYGRYWYDTFALASMSDEQMRARLRLGRRPVPVGADLARAGRDRGAARTSGNWDACGRDMTARGLPVVAVAERLRPERLYRLFVRSARPTAPHHGLSGAPGAGRSLSAAIEEGNVLALLADRDLLRPRDRGADVRAPPAGMPAGPAMLALSTGAPIVVVARATRPRRAGGSCSRARSMPEPTGDRQADARAITQRDRRGVRAR